MPSDLSVLRRRAGYKSQKAFAEAAGIPLPTYARYETNPAKIPIKSAWAIADMLGTSIDVVVGRRSITDADAEAGEVQREYDALSESGRDSMDEFRRYVRWQEERGRADDERRCARVFDLVMYRYADMLLADQAESAAFGEAVVWDDPAAARRAFERYLNKQAEKKRAASAGEDEAKVKARHEAAIAKLMEAWDRHCVGRCTDDNPAQ